MHYKRSCPDRILLNAADGFLFGIIGGAAYVAVADRQSGNVIQNVVRRAPVFAIGTSFVLIVYSALDCTTEAVRNRRDAVNCFIAGGITGALLGARAGPQGMAVNAIIGAVAFGVMDGIL